MQSPSLSKNIAAEKSFDQETQKMSFKEYCSKNLENIICFGAAGLMVIIGIVAFVCIYFSK